MRSLLVLILCILLFLPGCIMRVGPKTIKPDRFDYSAAISNSWKSQMLTNLVKMRYLDPPFFLDVAQVVTGYTWEASAEVSTPDWTSAPWAPGVTASGRWAESPTITYNPMTGDKFTKSLLQPVPPVTLFELVQAGWPIDKVFALAARSINGLHAVSHLQMLKRPADLQYYQLLALLRELQLSETVSFRIEKGEAGDQTEIVFQPREQDAEMKAKSLEARKLLSLNLEETKFKIVFASVQKDDKEIAMATRSILEILGESAAGVEVPESHVKEGRVVPLANVAGAPGPASLVHVHSGTGKPNANDVFAAMQYKGHWFWIDDRDVASKRGMGFLLMLSTLAEAGTSISPPVLTISKP